MDWLDRLTFREIEQINEKQKRVSKQTYLMVEFPEVVHRLDKLDIVYFETGAEEVIVAPTKSHRALFYDSTINMVWIWTQNKHLLSPGRDKISR